MSDYQDIFKRVEKKYLLDHAQYTRLLAGIGQHGLKRDCYGLHTISNIYFDTEDFALIRLSLQKPVYKEKLRLRVYGTDVDLHTQSFVEIKKKFDGVVYKRRTSLPLQEAVWALRLRHMPEACGQIGREIDRFVRFWPVSPKALIAYDREAYGSVEEPELRLTFDHHIRFRAKALDLTQGSSGRMILAPEQTLLEIKLPDAMPLWLCRLLGSISARPVSFSKYGTAYTRYLFPEVASPKRRLSACLTAS